MDVIDEDQVLFSALDPVTRAEGPHGETLRRVFQKLTQFSHGDSAGQSVYHHDTRCLFLICQTNSTAAVFRLAVSAEAQGNFI